MSPSERPQLGELTIRPTTEGYGRPVPPDAITRDPRAVVDDLLRLTVAYGGSDLHLTAGVPPCIRVDGELRPVEHYVALTPLDTSQMLGSILTPQHWQRFERTRELDTSYSLTGVSRFRVNVFQQRGSVGAVMRTIPHTIRGLDELGLPSGVDRLAHLPRGLVLVTGPTGSGKTTTLAALVDVVNKTRSAHIMTIEDPIEYLHQHQRSIVNQREVGEDTDDFATALRQGLRQDPDVILVGELRDLETTSVAVTAAETGHLVLATLHTQSAAQTIDRLIDIFPAHQQAQVRTQLANCLQGVITQALAPRRDGLGRTIVCEVLVTTPAIRNLIREAKVHQIGTFLQSSASLGMISFDQHLAQRYHEQLVSMHTALELAHDPAELRQLARM